MEAGISGSGSASASVPSGLGLGVDLILARRLTFLDSSYASLLAYLSLSTIEALSTAKALYHSLLTKPSPTSLLSTAHLPTQTQ